jgi:hypothetical protein
VSDPVEGAAPQPGEGEDPTSEPIEKLLDLCVYAPLGLVLDARRVVPELAEQGRAQVRMARMVGEFAVGWGNQRLQSTLSDAQDHALDLLRRIGVASPEPEQAPGAPDDESDDLWPGEPYAETTAEEPEAAAPSGYDGPAWQEAEEAADRTGGYDGPTWVEEQAADGGGASALAIPDYDNLSASQVVPRLDGLTTGELEAVRLYERSNRHRKTILSRIAQLQSGSG